MHQLRPEAVGLANHMVNLVALLTLRLPFFMLPSLPSSSAESSTKSSTEPSPLRYSTSCLSIRLQEATSARAQDEMIANQPSSLPSPSSTWSQQPL